MRGTSCVGRDRPVGDTSLGPQATLSRQRCMCRPQNWSPMTERPALVLVLAAALVAADPSPSTRGVGLTVTSVFVSPSGSDAATGKDVASPVQTLRRARDVLRSSPRKGRSLVTVHVAPGGYFLGNESLALTPEDTNVLWKGAPNGSSVVYAGTRLTGWQPVGGASSSSGIYRTKWSGPRFYALTEGKLPAALARHPDPGSGYLQLTAK